VASADFLQCNINLSFNSRVDHPCSNVAFECDILSFGESADSIFLETFSLESYLLNIVFEVIVLLVAHVNLVFICIIWVNLIHWLGCVRFDDYVVIFPVCHVFLDQELREKEVVHFQKRVEHY